jgi:hypothetical protein
MSEYEIGNPLHPSFDLSENTKPKKKKYVQSEPVKPSEPKMPSVEDIVNALTDQVHDLQKQVLELTKENLTLQENPKLEPISEDVVLCHKAGLYKMFYAVFLGMQKHYYIGGGINKLPDILCGLEPSQARAEWEKIRDYVNAGK